MEDIQHIFQKGKNVQIYISKICGNVGRKTLSCLEDKEHFLWWENHKSRILVQVKVATPEFVSEVHVLGPIGVIKVDSDVTTIRQEPGTTFTINFYHRIRGIQSKSTASAIKAPNKVSSHHA